MNKPTFIPKVKILVAKVCTKKKPKSTKDTNKKGYLSRTYCHFPFI